MDSQDMQPIHYIEHAVDVLSVARRHLDAQRPLALITAIQIMGGSSRELGTLALVTDDGQMHGYLSNGCIDRDIQLQALEVLRTGTAKVLQYGAGSPFQDLTLPCGGSLTLFIDPRPDAAQLIAAHDALRARGPATLRFSPPDHPPSSFTYAPKPRLVIAGRGSVFCAVAQTAQAADFELALLSPEEPDLARLATLNPAQSAWLTTPQSAAELTLDAYCAFLTLFHDHDWEPALLIRALATPARFIGCLGSRRTHDSRCEQLRELGATEDQIARIIGPLGLVPSLRQAPLIAVSAMAHIAQAFPRAIQTGTKEDP